MSLLLDALKKAAEQKAQKSKQEQQPETPSSDVTEVYEAPETAAELDARGEGSQQQPPRQGHDETQLDQSELEVPAGQTRSRRDPTDETGLDFDEETRTRLADPSRQMQTGEDETIVFSDEDVSEFLDGPVRAERRPDDETDLSAPPPRDDSTELRLRPPRDEETDLSRIPGDDPTEVKPSPLRDDETDLSRVDVRDDETEFPPARVDETEFPPARDDETEFPPARDDETEFPPARVDETDLSQLAGDDESAAQRPAPRDDETDISIPSGRADDFDSGVAGRDDTDLDRFAAEAADETGRDLDEDLSLLLVDRDPTGMTGTSVTDPQPPSAPVGALEEGDDLALVDTTRHRPPPADSTLTGRSATATTRSAETLTGEATTRRVDSTSTATTGATTRTYAPDNYDRTLMKLPSEDASRLFAGMKSDADVVMTPDYAKKVFQSKSSAQRIQHYKLYAGIAFAILLAIGVYGLFEMQAESSRIESSLQPLKRDPMPGIIRPEPTQPTGITLPAIGVDEKTIELVESAGNEPVAGAIGQAVSEQGVIAAEAESAAAGGSAAQDTPGSAPGTRTVAATRPAPGPESIITGEIGTEARASASGGSSLEIRSSSRVSDRDRWLREAYDAYVTGNDARALEAYNRVLEIDPRNRNALLARAAINVQNGDTTAAIVDYQSLLLANPKDSLAMSSLLTVANYSPQEAESQIKLMLRDEPESPYLNFALANAYGAQKRWQEAQAHYFTALQNNPDDPNYAYNLAVSLEHIAKPEVAIAYYQRALENFDKGLATFSKDVVDQRLETLKKL